MRNSATYAEKILWTKLQKSRLNGFKFRRQQGIGYYIVDFYCASVKLVIELDGGVHSEKQVILNDIERQKNIEALGLRVLRFTNEEVFSNLDKVLSEILLALQSSELRTPS